MYGASSSMKSDKVFADVIREVVSIAGYSEDFYDKFLQLCAKKASTELRKQYPSKRTISVEDAKYAFARATTSLFLSLIRTIVPNLHSDQSIELYKLLGETSTN